MRVLEASFEEKESKWAKFFKAEAGLAGSLEFSNFYKEYIRNYLLPVIHFPSSLSSPSSSSSSSTSRGQLNSCCSSKNSCTSCTTYQPVAVCRPSTSSRSAAQESSPAPSSGRKQGSTSFKEAAKSRGLSTVRHLSPATPVRELAGQRGGQLMKC